MDLINVKRGKRTQTTSIQLFLDRAIDELDQVECYKYLRVERGGGGVIQHQTMEIDICKEYYKWVRLMFRRELNVEKESRTLTSLLYHW